MNKSNSNLSIKGFTLAEVLITLTIIGVVASITMPTLIQQKNNNEIKARVKKSYATLSNAFELAKAEHGDFDSWDWGSGDPNKILDIVAPHLNIKEKCGTDNGCFPDQSYKYLDGRDSTNYSTDTSMAKARLSDGASISVYPDYAECGLRPLGHIYLDINGDSAPNEMGYDMFYYIVDKNRGLIPFDDQSASLYGFGSYAECSLLGTGLTCASKIIYDDNVSYLNSKLGTCIGACEGNPCTDNDDCADGSGTCKF